MNIGIDGYEANTTNRVGIGQYAYQLLVQLSKLGTKNKYTIFLPTPAVADMPKENTHWKYVIGSSGSFWTIKQLPFLIRRQALDVFFSPTHYTPWFTTIPKAMSVMDLSYLHYPELFKKKDFIQLQYMGGFSIRNAQHIFTISEFSKKEILKNYHIPAEKITVTYPGHEHLSTHVIETSLSKKTGENYILFVGTLQPRKNVERLIEAYESTQTDHKLVIVGKRGWLYESILKKMQTSSKKDSIVYLEFVSDEELTVLYAKAAFLVLPSLYEGFGIPVLEAHTHSLPVVVSNTTSLPEVAGEAGIYVDPTNTSSIAEGITKALQLSESDRKKLAGEAKKQLAKFSWKKTAEQTLEVLENLKK